MAYDEITGQPYEEIKLKFSEKETILKVLTERRSQLELELSNLEDAIRRIENQ